MFLLLCTITNIGSFYQKQTVQNIKHLINTRECKYNSSWDMAWSAQSQLWKDGTLCDANDVSYGSK